MNTYHRQRGIGGLALFAIIAAIAVLGGAFVYTMGKKTTAPDISKTEDVIVSPTTTPATAGDTTDEGLAKDSADVDSKLKAATEDSAGVDAGLNDQQGNLSEQ